ncbi:class I SAM-dependent methyltransferase [Umezawaea endophytica]|uniref:Class I SAM-dependent methyltransferase n=1 Tax=Umezawaea endophytica TaxID=1654476 RepID=A0A9X3AK66_9PSEU|nr:class I SAM-dependent methyltransferase [Umezawaea endophytica]MCS7482460.1 class I SAM-dependent methyltransferase [Umezawaea endophytica]
MPAQHVTPTNVMRLLAGLVDRLLAPVEGLPSGSHVMQLACGTGELSLELARRRPDLRITAIDVDSTVLDAGRAAAVERDLSVEFRTMSMAGLDLADGGVDAVISRMGMFLPGTAPFDVVAREAARVLRPGGPLSIATWSDLAGSPYTRIGLSVLRRVLPAGAVPDMESFFSDSARPGAFEGHLADAGFQDVEAAWFRWDTEYPDFEAWWRFVAEFGALKPLFDSLDASTRATARDVMESTMAEHGTGSGGYRLTATARVVTARR